ncbi:MAG: aminotransferase class V-fold PLP-dependent enzyme, partial [Bryobacterales bacterium]|nr:aminotransferase class V-fold PLP-dependent enzyme [Bryobacterales bacterium]
MTTDWQSVRDEFPALAHCTWLNTATFGQVPLRAQSAIARHYNNRNLLGGRDFLDWFAEADDIRQDVAQLFGASVDDVAFIPHTSSALSLLVNGIDWRKGDEIVTFEEEFPNQIYAAAVLEERGVRLVRTRLTEWESALNERTRMMAVSQTNYANGMEAPVPEMAAKLRAQGGLLYVDGTQTAGARQFDFGACEPDLYSVNAYKWMNSPPGAGFMLVSRRTRQWLKPATVGWRSDRNWRNVNNLHDGRPEFSEAADRYEGGMLPFVNLFAMREAIRLLAEVGLAEAVRLGLGTPETAEGLPVEQVEYEGWFKEWMDRFAGQEKLAVLPPPEGLQASLRSYQQYGYSWLAFLRRWGLGACLADDMGLGKTVQTLALILHEKEE